MNSILIAAGVIAATGLLSGVLLALASHFMRVEEDETVKKIRECLPGANCGACGYAGCDDYANALSNGNAKTNLCVPGGDRVASEIASVLGVAAEDVVEKIAVVHCNGTCDATEKKNLYNGVNSCAAQGSLFGGPGSCRYGCLGCGDCAAVCPNDAICLKDGIARINREKCVGCGMCASACPKKIISIVPDIKEVAVLCSNRDKGAVARKACKNACIGCKKCELNCPEKAIAVKDNAAVIDYDKCTGCKTCIEGCPTHAIKLI